MKKVFFSFLIVTLVLSFGGLFIKAETETPENTTTVSIVDGVKIRTDGYNGLKWEAKVENPILGATYGFILGKGEHTSDELIIDNAESEDIEVVELTSVNDENKFCVTMINIPERGYAQNISVRAFTVVDGVYIYSEDIVIRNLAEVALIHAKDGNSHEFSDKVINYVNDNYMSVYVAFDGTICIGNAKYEANPANLAKEFVNDWNQKFGTTWTSFSGTKFSQSASLGSTPLASSSDTDPLGTNAYEFFVNDAKTSAKWKWLLNYLFEETNTRVHPKRQIKSILDGAYYQPDTYSTGLYQFTHLGGSLENFFYGNDSSHNTNTNYITFDDCSAYAQITNYNKTIIASNPILAQVGSNYELTLGDKTGYDFNGYINGETLFNDEYVVTKDVVSLAPQFEAVNYTIKYMNGEEELTDLAATYTVEDNVTLPILEIEDYDFHGWYDNPFFEGDAITEITSGSIEDRIFYAKLTSTIYEKVNVTYDTTEGAFKDLNNIPLRKEFNVVKVANWAANGTGTYLAPSNSSSTLQYQYKILLAYDSTKSLYKVIATDAAVNPTTAIANGAAWDYTLADPDNNITTNVSVGQYVQLDVDALKAGTAQTAKLYNLDDLTGFTITLKDPCKLPVPYLEGATFMGWKSSIDEEVITDYPGYNENPGDIIYTAQWSFAEEVDVIFDYNGGGTTSLYQTNGTLLSSLIVNNYNGNFWGDYATDIFAFTSGKDQKPQNSTRIYLGKNATTGYYEVLSVLLSGVSSWPTDAELVITISDSYTGNDDANFDASKISAGDIVFMSGSITSASTTPVTITFYDEVIANEEVKEHVDGNFTLPTPVKSGYSFAGWYDENGNKHTSAASLISAGNITVTAKWAFQDRIIGSFDTYSWVVVDGETIKLNAEMVESKNRTFAWTSLTPNIATVDENGDVSGVSEGLATIVVSDAEFDTINFTFYVTVVANDAGIVGLLLESNNEEIFTRDDLGIGAGTPAYYYDVIGSVSKLLFTPYVEHKDYYLSSPSKKTTLSGSGTGGVDFITLHYAADMPYSAKYSKTGGKNLASYNQTASGASWNYSTGNDGIWYCQNTAYGSWHAGTSKSMKWYSTGVTTSQIGTDVYTTDVTLKSDNYFYIKGVKTTVKNTTGYSYTKLNDMGLAVKLVGSEWYIGGCYYNSSYKYISSLGGNLNSIGIESSVREGSDLWLTWQYSAQLCAKLLNQFNLPLNRLVGHHFFSGKDCPQPMLENDLEIWYEFVEMTRQEMALRQKYSSYTITCKPNTSYVNSFGRVTSLPNYTQCVTYTVTYTTGSTSKTITLSTILPGTIA